MLGLVTVRWPPPTSVMIAAAVDVLRTNCWPEGVSMSLFCLDGCGPPPGQGPTGVEPREANGEQPFGVFLLVKIPETPFQKLLQGDHPVRAVRISAVGDDEPRQAGVSHH
jgi:hypothetical protein